MASDIWLRTILIVRKETRCRHIGYSFRLAARVLLYAPSHRQDNTYHTFFTPVVEHWLEREIALWVHPMKDRSDDPSHDERTLLPRSYISLPTRCRYTKCFKDICIIILYYTVIAVIKKFMLKLPSRRVKCFNSISFFFPRIFPRIINN